jgi:hypothetical protein
VEPIFDLDEDQLSAAFYNQINFTCCAAAAARQNAIATLLKLPASDALSKMPATLGLPAVLC